jgi:hypothetical protein
MGFGTLGRITNINDFCGSFEDETWATSSVDLGDGWYMVSVNEGTIQKVVDEPGGVIQFLTDTGDNDNAALLSGPYRPADGGVEMECRFKVADALTVAFFVGFSETMAQLTPVMPAEFNTVTMTYNGSGGMAGFSYDSDGTDDDFRAVAGDAGAVSANADANGTRANQTITADEWYVCRVEIDTAGKATMSISHDSNSDMEIVKEVVGAVNPADNFYAVCMLENRTAAAYEFEVDYVAAWAKRDWTN